MKKIIIIFILNIFLSPWVYAKDNPLLTPKSHFVALWRQPVLRKIIVKDTDGDGIIDRFDECPTTWGLPERNGCPDIDITKIISVACPTIVFSDEEFDIIVDAFSALKFDIATLLVYSHDAIDKFIELFNNNPTWLITFSVYVDDASDRNENLNLSKRRLKEMIDYFERNGISKRRITGKYFGDTMPVIDLPGTRFEVELTEPQKKHSQKKTSKKYK